MKKLTEVEKLKYWLDAEMSILHAMIALVLFNIITSGFMQVMIAIYITYNFVYAFTRMLYIGSIDNDYLKVPKK